MNFARSGLAAMRRSPWPIPVVAAVVIIVSWVFGALALPGSDAFMVAAAVIAGAGIARDAGRGLLNRVIGIDLLVTIAAVGAILLGNYWEAAAVTTLFAIGHALERVTMARTRSALAELVAAAPEVATVVRDGDEVTIAALEVLTGETVIIKAGAVVPVDGTIAAGVGAVNEAGITGESIPAEKSVGDTVFAGTVLTSGHLRVTATGVGSQTTLARIIHRVEDAQDARAKTQTFLEKFSRWYTPAIVVLAVVGGLVTGNIELALTLLVIGCPGALVISVPVAIVAGVGRGARDGILIKGGEHLERAARINVVALDKTGTLTAGRPELTDVVPLAGFSRDEVLRWAAIAEAGSEHPLAQPIVAAARERNLALANDDVAYEPTIGYGITARTAGYVVVVGKAELVTEVFGQVNLAPAQRVIEELGALGRTAMVVGLAGQVIGVIAVADTLRPDAITAVAQLKTGGVKRVIMLTGDRESVAQAVAAQAGIDEVHAGLLPEEKLAVIAELQAQGHKVAMIGDGVNDSPALASADTGIAMGASGSALAVETADIALLTDRLDRAATGLRLARSTVRVMRQNIIIAVATVALLLAGVLIGGVTMSIGMLVHEASVLIVVINAVRLLGRRPAPLLPARAASWATTGDLATV